MADFLKLLVFPSHCRLCGGFLAGAGENTVCSACLGKIDTWDGPKCPVCGRFFEGNTDSHICGQCLASPPYFSRHTSLGRYDGVLREVIVLFKYGGFSNLGRKLGRLAGEFLERNSDMLYELDMIIPVPLYPKRQRERGFNQSLVIAREISRITGIRVVQKGLIRIKDAPAQVSLHAAARERNVKGVYAVRKPRLIEGKTVLLVDDVFTTGATIGECSRVLRRGGAREVRALTLARA